MNRTLQFVNLFGVVILAAVCGAQWTINRKVNLEANRLEKVRIEQQQQLEERDKAIKGQLADLDTFRERIQSLSKSMKESETKAAQFESKFTQAEADREQLKENIRKWTEAVQQRDQELTKARDQIQTLATNRNGAVERFNELAEKYNAVVKDLNKRSDEFNSLVEKIQQTRQNRIELTFAFSPETPGDL